MNSLHRKPNPAAEEQASLWAARLEGGTLTATDREALDTWLNEDAAHRSLLSRYCQFSADLEEQLLTLVATGGVRLPPEPKLAPVLRRGNFKWIASTALAAAAVVALAVWVARPAPRVETIATAAAQRSTLTLTDGTKVELNARTSLSFENGSTERHVRLAGGEAFFTVSKDQSRPFVIDTPAGSVRVTGTVFNVRIESPSDLEVTVVEGSVQVRPGEPAAARAADPVALGARDWLSAIRGKVQKRTLTAAELDDALAWREGQIVFRDVPIRDALKIFGSYHGVGIFPSAGVVASNKTVGGRKNIDDLHGFLRDLQAADLDLRVEYEPNSTFRVGLRNEP